MSVRLMTEVWACDVKGGEQLVLLALADHGRDDGTRVYPAIDTVAWKVGLKRRRVQEIVSSLRERGVLVVVRESTRYDPTRYRMDLSKLARKPPLRDAAQCTPGEASRVQPSALRGAAQCVSGVHPTAPEPSKEPSREPSITTTTRASQVSDDLDGPGCYVGADLVEMYADAIERDTGSRPRRKAGDLEAADALAETLDEARAWEYEGAIAYGLTDTGYSRPKILKGFQSALKCWEAIVPHMQAAPQVRCSLQTSLNCSDGEETFPASPDQVKVIRDCERVGREANDLVCPACQREPEPEPVAVAAQPEAEDIPF